MNVLDIKKVPKKPEICQDSIVCTFLDMICLGDVLTETPV